jgi:hypothetical protein
MIDLDRLYNEANDSWNHAEKIRGILERIEQETLKGINLHSNYLDVSQFIKEGNERIEELKQQRESYDWAIRLQDYAIKLNEWILKKINDNDQSPM